MKKPLSKKRINQIIYKKESEIPLAAISMSDMKYNKTGQWRSMKPVIHYDKCTSCMLCWKFCPDAAVTIVNGKPCIDLDYCKGCMICVEECPAKAIKPEEEEK